MQETNQGIPQVGLTITYNRLKDPHSSDLRVLELRALHEETDRAVLAAYSESDSTGCWNEIDVPPYCPTTDEDMAKLEAFEGAVIDRLFVLNAKRAEEEKLRGGGPALAAKPNGALRSASVKEPSDAQLELAVEGSRERPARMKKRPAKLRGDGDGSDEGG